MIARKSPAKRESPGRLVGGPLLGSVLAQTFSRREGAERARGNSRRAPERPTPARGHPCSLRGPPRPAPSLPGDRDPGRERGGLKGNRDLRSVPSDLSSARRAGGAGGDEEARADLGPRASGAARAGAPVRRRRPRGRGPEPPRPLALATHSQARVPPMGLGVSGPARSTPPAPRRRGRPEIGRRKAPTDRTFGPEVWVRFGALF